MKRGLVVGKFMPLHRGHQLMIENALARCDDVTVVVYDTTVLGEHAPMPVQLRARWLAELYPQLESIVPRADPLGDLPQEERDQPYHGALYAHDLEFLGQFDEVITSEPGYGPFARALNAEHVIVDAARELVPISGTQIRQDPYAHRGYIDPRVYGDLIQKVVFVGTESTGKTTLARAMAHEYDTWWVHEFGRELWVKQGGGSFNDHVKMGRRQYAREEAALQNSNRYLFCDTNAWTTLMWSHMAYGTADARLEELVERTLHEYIWVMCDNDIGWVDDGVRELRDNHVDFHLQQITDLDDRLTPRDITWHIALGSLEERVADLKKYLDAR